MKKPREQLTNRGARTYLAHAVKAASHPVRREILKTLKEGPLSSVDLEDKLGESRYNLYHHLNVLEDVPLITSSIGEGRSKVFELYNPKRPEVAFVVLDSRDKEEAKALKKILKLLDEETAEGVPHRRDIRRAKMVFYYPWSSEE